MPARASEVLTAAPRCAATSHSSSSRTPSSHRGSGRGSRSWCSSRRRARIEADLALGRHAELVAELEALCEKHPFRERFWELRMLALYRSGRQADALRAYGSTRVRARRGARARTRSGSPRPRGAHPRAGPDPRCAPARVRVATGGADGNLRRPLNSFVGRDDEIARVLELSASARLVTLIGPGGAGKTRLAVEVALRLRPELPGGAWMVELAGDERPEGIASAIATRSR